MLNSQFSSLLLLSLSTSILASNDWSKPCFNGLCSYDLPSTPSGPSGTLKIWGSNAAIADITTAGGWEIVGCDPDKEEQDIRIVCRGVDVDGDGDNDGCAHLFASSGGSGASTTSGITSLPVPTGTVVQIGDEADDEDRQAIGKIVRLPPECGKQAFGRIANTWTDTDQSLPPAISKRLPLPLHRRTKHHHKVKGLTIDTQFQKTDRTRFGDVKFAIVGANVPGAKASEGDLDVDSLGKRVFKEEHLKGKRNFVHSRVFRQRRGFGDFLDDVGGAISDGAGAVGGAISDGAAAVGGAISDGAAAVGGAISDGVGAVGGAISDGAGAVGGVISDGAGAVGDAAGVVGDAISDGAVAVGGAISDGAEAVGGAIADGAGAVGDAISDGAAAVADGAEAVGGAIADGAEAVGDALSGPQEFSKTISAPLDISKTFTVFEQSIKCSAPIGSANNNSSFNPKVGVNGRLKVDVEADVQGNVAISVFASGSLTELKLDKFELKTSLDADLKGAIILSAGVGGSIESGNIKLFEVGIPGLDFPGIFSIGPTFQINGNAKASLNIDADMRIGVAYQIDNVEFNFPNGGKKSGSFSAGDTPLQISAQPSSSATGTVEAHLIPSLNLGINAFGGVAKAEVFVNLDASASVSLTVDATVKRRELMVRGRGPIGAYYFSKRTPVPEPLGFGDIVDGIKDGATKAAGAVEDGVKKAAGAVESGSKKVVDGAKKAVESGAGAVKEGAKKIEEGAKKVGGAVEDGVKKAADVVESGAKKVKDGAKKAVESGAGAVKEGAKKIEEGAKKVGGAIEDGAKKVGGAVKEGADKVAEEGAKKVEEGAKEEGAKKGGAKDDVSVKFGGCVDVGAGLSVNVGADASFFGLFDPSKKIPLFEKKFSLLQKCFGEGKKRRDLGAVLVGRGLVCNGVNVSGVVELANQVVRVA